MIVKRKAASRESMRLVLGQYGVFWSSLLQIRKKGLLKNCKNGKI